MNYMEQYIFKEHMKNINTDFEDFAKEIMALQNKDTFTLLFATDVHYIRKFALYIPTYYKLKEMVDFSGYIGADLLALGGDTVDGNTTLSRQYRDLYDILALVRNAKTTSVAISKGNHDDCSWYAWQKDLGIENTITPEQWYAHVINPIRVSYPITLDNENIAGGYYYIDYPLQKIRVINLNTNDTPYIFDNNGKFVDKAIVGQWCHNFSSRQLEWLKEALTFEEEGWSVLPLSHVGAPIDHNVHNRHIVTALLYAFKNKTKGRVTNDEKYFEADISFDFTNNKSSDLLPYLCGHNHIDSTTYVDGITVVSTRNMLGQDKNITWDNPQENTFGSWDCMIIDKKSHKLITKRYTQPEFDREIDY